MEKKLHTTLLLPEHQTSFLLLYFCLQAALFLVQLQGLLLWVLYLVFLLFWYSFISLKKSIFLSCQNTVSTTQQVLVQNKFMFLCRFSY